MRDQYSRAPTFIGLGKTPVATSRKNAASDMTQYAIPVLRSIIAGQYGSLSPLRIIGGPPRRRRRCPSPLESSPPSRLQYHNQPTPPTSAHVRTASRGEER